MLGDGRDGARVTKNLGGVGGAGAVWIWWSEGYETRRRNRNSWVVSRCVSYTDKETFCFEVRWNRFNYSTGDWGGKMSI